MSIEEHYPDDRYYYSEHEWIKPLGQDEAFLGISWYAQNELGEIVFVDVPENGTPLVLGQPFGEI